ncbi:hypothetical protein pipiens_020197, partial [Culex pipiens pipiens]
SSTSARQRPQIGVFVWGEFASADDRRNRRLSRSVSSESGTAQQGFNWRAHEGARNSVLPSRVSTGGRTKELGIRYCPAGLQLAGARRSAEFGTAQQGFNWRAHEGVRNPVLPSRASTGWRTKDIGVRHSSSGVLSELHLKNRARAAGAALACEGR